MTVTSETRSVAGRVTALYRRAGNAGHSRLGLALAVIAVSQLIVLMGTTMVTMSLSRIQSALGFSTTGLLWVVNLYGLIFGGLLLSGGRIGDILGTVESTLGSEGTTIVVVADHGMELNDPLVNGDWGDALKAAGISFRDEASGFLYFGVGPDAS